MCSPDMQQTDEKQWSQYPAAVGFMLNAVGIYGVWFQGDFWGYLGGAIRGNLEAGEVYFVLGLPAAVTVAGALLVAWVVLGSPVALKWSVRRRNTVFACYAVILLAGIGRAAVLGRHHLWAIERR